MNKEKDEMKQLPPEIIEEILVRIQVKSLLRFRCVSKSWLSLIRNVHFIRAHLRRSIENNNSKLILASRHSLHLLDFFESHDEPIAGKFVLPFDFYGGSMNLMGSCNGLVCLSDRATSTEIVTNVWNPATSEHVKLSYLHPKLPKIHLMPTGLGFGFTPATNEYKLVIFVDHFRIASYVEKTFQRTDVIVCTLGENSWRTILNVPYFVSLYSQAAELHGALHWMATRMEGKNKIVLVICFDLLNEEFRELQLPHFGDSGVSLKIAVVGGCLAVLGHFSHGGPFEIWVMNDYGNEQSWTKQFSFSDEASSLIGNVGDIHPLGFTKKGEILLEKGKSNLALYNPVNKRIRNLLVLGKPDVLEAYGYVDSLVSLGVGDDVEG